MSLLVGDAATAVAAQRVCADHGVLVGCFRPPSVPPGAACLRVTARAGLSAGDIDRVRVALTAARAEVARLTAAEAHTVPPQGVPA
jgi:8-amino-7-oxononanoate synthase